MLLISLLVLIKAWHIAAAHVFNNASRDAPSITTDARLVLKSEDVLWQETSVANPYNGLIMLVDGFFNSVFERKAETVFTLQRFSVTADLRCASEDPCSELALHYGVLF